MLVSFGWPLFFLSLGQYAAFLAHLVTAPWGAAAFGVPITCCSARRRRFRDLRLARADWLTTSRDPPPRVADSPALVASLMFVGLVCISLSRTFIYFRF